MRIKEGFVLQELIDDFIVVPVGEEADRVHGIIRLNETGAFLWKLLSQDNMEEEELTSAMAKKYSTDPEMIKEDVALFVNMIKEFGCM